MSFTVYKSSAGSGKTFTLVKEYLRMALSDKSEPPQKYRRILAITFTNKAAAEMKERILRALEELSHYPLKKENTLAKLLQQELMIDPISLSERARALLTAILHHYTDFAIGTIDSFVHRIVRTFAYDLHLPLNFEIETDADKLLGQAVDLLVGRIGGDEALTNLLVQFAENKTDDDKSWHIEQELRTMAQQLLSEEGAAFADRLRQLAITDFISIRKKINEAVGAFEKRVTEIGKKGSQLMAGVDTAAFYQGSKGIPSFFSALAKGDTEKLVKGNSYATQSFEQEKWFGTKATAAQKNAVEEILPQLRDLWNEACELRDNEYPTYTERSLLLRNCYALAVLNEIEKLLFHFKTENSILHISEFNRLIAKVVSDERVPFIYERLGEKYTNYLVDEFQDTSVLQWQNLLPLVENALAEDHFTMLVGDGKQAIYRWRGGEVEQFAQLPKVFGHNNNELLKEREQSLVRHYDERRLFRNFRSKREIIEFNNRFFRTVSAMLEERFAKIYDGLEQEFDPENKGGFIQVDIVPETDDSDEEQVRRVIERVKNLREENFRFSDIAVLTRVNKHGSMIAAALIAEGIPVLTSESLLLRLSPAVGFMTAALRCLDHTGDDVAKAQMLNFLISTKKIAGPLHERLYELRELEGSISNLLARQGISFPVVILAKQPVYQRCESLMRIFDLNTEPDPYLTGFLDEVLSFAGSRKNQPKEFSDWWEDRREKASLVVPEGMDAVRILSIHKAKGLEFPAVIFPFADWKISDNRKQIWVNWHDDLTPGLTAALLPLSQQLELTRYAPQYAEERSKSLLDDLNLVYVALTRPSERLYVLTGETKEKERPSSVSDFFAFFFRKQEIDVKEGSWSEGNLQPFQPHQQKQQAEFLRSENYHHFDWPQKISIRSNAGAAWAIDEAGKHRDRGILVHTVLSRVKTSDDLEQSLQTAVSEGLLDDDEKEALHIRLLRLLNLPELAPWFMPGLDIRNETDILLPDGSMYRPDRVVLAPDYTVVIDYKTGREAETHIRQLRQYAKLLTEMGYRNVKKYLVYTEEFIAEEID